jgi:hypothetical protein
VDTESLKTTCEELRYLGVPPKQLARWFITQALASKPRYKSDLQQAAKELNIPWHHVASLKDLNIVKLYVGSEWIYTYPQFTQTTLRVNPARLNKQ